MRHSKLLAVSMIAMLASIGPALASPPPSLPAGASFTIGAGNVGTSGSTETVTISAAGLPTVINWSGGYDVAKGSTIAYVPGSAVTNSTGYGDVVNIDTSGAESAINGTISSSDFGQVVVNANGVSVGSSAVLPSNVVLAAGSYDSSTNSITADTAPVTIAPGATFSTTPDPSTGGVTIANVYAQSGDTLPDTSAEIVPVNQTTIGSVVVPANAPASFTLQPGQTGQYAFTGPQTTTSNGSTTPSAPSDITITGPASGTVGSVYFVEPEQFGFDTVTGAETPDTNSGSFTLSNIDSTGSITVATGGNISASGSFTAGAGLQSGVLFDAISYATSGPGTTEYMQNAPPSSLGTATLNIAPGTTFRDSTVPISSTSVNLQGDVVNVGSGVTIDSANNEILANNGIGGTSASPGSITDSGMLMINGDTISNISVQAPQIDAQANNITGATLGATGNGGLTVNPAAYETVTGGTPDTAPLVISNSTLSGPAMTVDSPLANGVQITGSTISNTSTSAPVTTIESGSNSQSLPGSVTITGSTVTQAGGVINVDAKDGGSVNVATGSDLSTNQGGACTTAGNCNTVINAPTVSFASGNVEQASATDEYTGTATGTSSGNPAEVRNSAASTSSGVIVSGGSAVIAGELDAGTPLVATGSGSGTGSTGTGSTGGSTGSTGSGSTGGSTGSGSTGGSTGSGSTGSTGGSTGSGSTGSTGGSGSTGSTGGSTGSGSTGSTAPVTVTKQPGAGSSTPPIVVTKQPSTGSTTPPVTVTKPVTLSVPSTISTGRVSVASSIIEINPSTQVSTTQMRGNTVLVPTSDAAQASPDVTIGQPAASSEGSPQAPASGASISISGPTASTTAPAKKR